MPSIARDTKNVASGLWDQSSRTACRWQDCHLSALLLMLLCCQMPALAKEFTGMVIGISDGDTITVLHKGIPERIRLSGIDCPEKKQAFGQAAKQFTAAECFGKVVTINDHGHDRYGRTIGAVLLPDGRLLNEDLLINGYAWQYKRYSHDPTLGAEELQARNGHVGLWADQNPEPPWQYRWLARHQHKQ